MSAVIESPCVKVCAIDATTGWCLGCGRSMREIGAWGSLPPEVRRVVMGELEGRLAKIPDRVARAGLHRLPGA